jgi:hypothetical protein
MQERSVDMYSAPHRTNNSNNNNSKYQQQQNIDNFLRRERASSSISEVGEAMSRIGLSEFLDFWNGLMEL